MLPTSITKQQLNEKLEQYDSIIAELSSSSSSKSTSKSLAELDEWRRSTLPATMSARDKPHISKDELVDLLQCKLKRGKFRPTLAQLVASNEESSVSKITATAFSKISSDSELPRDQILAALKDATALRGVGPATATYILAAYRPSQIPVFSDEGFLWAMLEQGPGKGWDRKMKYDAKEYAAYLDRMAVHSKRLGVSAEDVERAGFVIRKEEMAKNGSSKKRKAVSSPNTVDDAPSKKVEKTKISGAVTDKPKKIKSGDSARATGSRKNGDASTRNKPAVSVAPSNRVLRSRRAIGDSE